ncbi:MAG: hypothetical protein WC307_04045 [Candidatus Nanoarchaeia archaeon]
MTFPVTGSASVELTCQLPSCPYGLPSAERLQVCVRAGDFEFPNCYALDTTMPLAGDPTGLGITITDPIEPVTFCGQADLEVSGELFDELGVYDSVSGLKVVDAADNRVGG